MTNILKYIPAFAAVLLSAHPALSQELLGIEGEDATSIGVYIKDIVHDEVLYDFNSEIALTPASVLKAVTTASALGIVGADFRFSTPIMLRGKQTSASVWAGDIIVESCGDPTIDSDYFKSNAGICDSIAAALTSMGISSIKGDIIIRQSLKDAGPVARWEVEDIAWPYGAGLHGLNYHDNVTTVYPITGRCNPCVPGLKIKVVDNAHSNDMLRGIGSDDLTIFTPHAGDKKWAVQVSVPDPAAVFTERLKKTLSAAGITVCGEKMSETSAPSVLLYTHHSPRAAEIMHSLMVRSDNLFAEGILRAIASGATRDDAIDREKRLWDERGIDTRYSIIFDGSGLTRGNRLQSRTLGNILEWMAKSDDAATYVSFFPKAGIDGTLRTFLDKTSLKGKIALKTGSMNAVQCYAGYKLDDSDNPTHVIVLMVNGFFCKRSDLRKSIESLLIDTFM